MWTSRIDLESLKNGAGGLGIPGGMTRHPLWVYKGTLAAVMPVILVLVLVGALLLLVMALIGAVAYGLLAGVSRVVGLVAGEPQTQTHPSDDGRRNVRVLD